MTWSRTYGGADFDTASSIQQTTDGGYIVAGGTKSFGAGSQDFWVLKLDASGNVTWQKTFGDAGWDRAYSIQQTTDGGYVVAATYESGMGYEFLVFKLNASGSRMWETGYRVGLGGPAYSIQETADGGYVIAGYEWCAGMNGQFCVLKLDASRNVQWHKSLGICMDLEEDGARSIQQTADGGYIVAGYTSVGGGGAWVMKLDTSGSVLWQNVFGGCSAHSVQQTSDGGYVVAAGIIIKLDDWGNIQWQKAHSGCNAYSVDQTTDGGYVVAGYTQSFGAGLEDLWVLKLDANGDIAPSCALIANATATVTPTSRDGSGTSWEGGTLVSVADTTLGGVNSSATVCDPCALPTAAPTVVPNPVCLDTAQTFTSNATGGTPPYTVEWDFDGDFVTDAVGDPVSYTYLALGTYSPNVRVSDSTGCLGAAWVPAELVVVQCPIAVYNAHTFTDCGNADGVVDPGETINLSVTAQNVGNMDAFNVSGALSTLTPGVSINVNNASFPDIPQALTGTSLTPFEFVYTGVICGTLIDFTLNLTYEDSAENPYSNATSFQVQVGQPAPPLFSENFELCTVPPAGWTEIENGTATVGWEPRGPDCPLGCSSGYPLPTNFAINDSDCQGPIVTQDTELITPLIDASAATQVTLTFDHNFLGYPGFFADTATVRMRSSDTKGIWATLFQWNENESNSGTVVLDATAVCAGTSDCQFEWHYQGNYDWYWAVDNVVVEGTPFLCNPAACSGCPAPSCSASVDVATVCLDTAQTFTATVLSGVPSFAYAWDFSYDGAFSIEGTGNPITYVQPAAGSYTVAARVTDSCGTGAQTTICTVATTIDGSPNLSYDAALDPTTTLAEVCGDGDLLVEPGEEWQATVQLINASACTANNVKADLAVNAGSAVAATVCNNPGAYGNIPPGGTAQFTYSFVVDSAAVCINDITFDVTGVVSDEGPGTNQVPAFNVTVGAYATQSATAPDIADFRDGVQTSDFAPPFTFAAPVSWANLNYTFTTKGGADTTACAKVELVGPGFTQLVKDYGEADPAKPVDVTAFYNGCDDCLTSDCGDGTDNDGDGFIDELVGGQCSDCLTTDCGDTTDNDGDLLTDEDNGPGLYQIRLSENAGCGANNQKVGLTLIALDVAKPECDPSACGCPAGPLPEVSSLVATNIEGTQWQVSDVAGALRYNVYTNPLASFGQELAEDKYDNGGVVANMCAASTTSILNYDLPPDSWFVVTAENDDPGSESTPGYDSEGTERRTFGTWVMCGP